MLARGLGLVALSAPTAALADDRVYCIHSKIKIESRPPADVGRSYSSSSLCTLGAFKNVSDARRFATENWKGEGQSCACR